MTLRAWPILAAFLTTWLAVWWFVHGRISTLAIDHPNDRSLHQAPVPRTGGIGLHGGILIAWILLSPSLPSTIAASYIALLVISFLDDLQDMPILVRLVAQLSAASAACIAFVYPDFGLPATLLLILSLAWITNLYNFMDGSDGLAGGMTLFGFLFYGLAAWLAGNVDFALLNLSIAAAAAAFLIFNFHPARIFMGDVGSVPLGFLAASFGLYGWLQHYWSWWFPVLVFSPFIVDASATLARRLWQRQKIWEAHRDHYYQRLVQLGWGHRNTALAEYALMAICGACGLAGLAWSFTAQAALIGVFMVAYLVLIGVIEHMWRGFRTRQ